MVSTRRGRSSLGCLVMLLFVSALCYFGVNVAEPYLRFYRFRDAMRQEARFARSRGDEDIKRRLAIFADSLGLPEDAADIRVRRRPTHIWIWAEYDEVVELPLIVRTIRFAPQADGSF